MQQEEFKTEDYGLASWLVFCRVTLLGAVQIKNNPRKKFYFLYVDSIPKHVEEWNSGVSDEIITCRKFFKALNTVKHALRESIDV